MDTTFKGKAVRITDVDIPRIGYHIGVGEDELHAFMDVEAAGSGFDDQGRPKMLFEPHKFYANTSGAERAAAVKAGLAYPKWGEKPYPRDSYPRLVKAMAIDEDAALKSASWGLTQILGVYHKDVGFDTVQGMVQAFMDSEAEHLEATVELLKKWQIDDDLRAHRWATVARAWNGPGYAKNRYDAKLAAAFAKWQKIRDAKWAPADAPPVVVAPATPPVVVVPIPPADQPVQDKPVVVTVDPTTGPAVQPPSAPVPPAVQPTVPQKHTGWLTAVALAIAAIAAYLKAHFGVH